MRMIVQDHGGKTYAGIEGVEFSSLSELLWSEDSSAFTVTSSDGGWVGGWSVEVFLIKYSQIERVDVSSQAKKDVMRRYQCDEPQNEEPNLVAVAWREGSSQLLLVAQVPPHSSCREMGKLFGYIVSVPSGKIVERFSEARLRNEWEST